MRPAPAALGARPTRADAIVGLCRDAPLGFGGFVGDGPTACPKPLFVVEVPVHGPAEIVGIPLPDTMVEALRASANLEPVLVDDHGARIATGRVRPVLSPKIVRGAAARRALPLARLHHDHGLQIHHLWPRSWGGTDDIANLAAVCAGGGTDHHPRLAPHGPSLLLGNPNQPDGLRLVHRDHLPRTAELPDHPPPPTTAAPDPHAA